MSITHCCVVVFCPVYVRWLWLINDYVNTRKTSSSSGEQYILLPAE